MIAITHRVKLAASSTNLSDFLQERKAHVMTAHNTNEWNKMFQVGSSHYESSLMGIETIYHFGFGPKHEYSRWRKCPFSMAQA